jgi:hypothetical protein
MVCGLVEMNRLRLNGEVSRVDEDCLEEKRQKEKKDWPSPKETKETSTRASELSEVPPCQTLCISPGKLEMNMVY